jgi:hypothetical protein
MNNGASMGLNRAVRRRNDSERILFGLTRDKSTGGTTPSLPKNAIENQNRYPVLLSFDQIPHLRDSSAARVTGLGKPNRERGPNLGVRGGPPFRSRGSDVLETPSGSESPHRPCSKHVRNSDHYKHQRHHGQHLKKAK